MQIKTKFEQYENFPKKQVKNITEFGTLFAICELRHVAAGEGEPSGGSAFYIVNKSDLIILFTF